MADDYFQPKYYCSVVGEEQKRRIKDPVIQAKLTE
jgi:hypothetical protein